MQNTSTSFDHHIVMWRSSSSSRWRQPQLSASVGLSIPSRPSCPLHSSRPRLFLTTHIKSQECFSKPISFRYDNPIWIYQLDNQTFFLLKRNAFPKSRIFPFCKYIWVKEKKVLGIRFYSDYFFSLRRNKDSLLCWNSTVDSSSKNNLDCSRSWTMDQPLAWKNWS